MKVSKSFEELLKRDPVFAEHWAKLPPRKPKPVPAVVAQVSDGFARAAQANPESVRVSVRSNDATLLERPKRVDLGLIDPSKIPEKGKSGVEKDGVVEYEIQRDEPGVPSFDGGGVVIHRYNPLDALGE
jgi:hypothetical protein